MTGKESSEIIQEWRTSAPYWEKHRDVIKAMFAPLTEALIEGAAISPGDRALDVAGGVGEPSFTISDTVGPSGLVVCTDAAPEMVAAAHREAHKRLDYRTDNIEFAVCTADELPFDSNRYEAVVCRLGAMFFPEPVRALREMLRVLEPAGRLSLAVWHYRDLNPFLSVVAEVVSRYVEAPPEDPEAPGAFRFAEPGKLAAALNEAGANAINERLLRFQIEAPITPERFWEVRSEMSDTLRRKLATLSADQVAQVARESQAAAAEYFAAGRIRFPGQILIVSGEKSSSS